MKRILVIVAIVTGLTILPFVPQVVGYVSTNIAKTGTVVDDDTGSPMPNVIVIASGWRTVGPVLFAPSSEKYFYQVVTRTDENGRFSIRSNWSGLDLLWPGGSPEYSWVITVFHVGYAVVGDEPNKELVAFGNPWYETPSLTSSPEFSFRGTSLEIPPIRMYKPTLELGEAANYYSRLQQLASGGKSSHQPELLRIRQQGNEYFAPWVCSLDKELQLDAQVRNRILRFPMSTESENLKRRYAEAEGHEYLSSAPSTSAGTVCMIITNGRGVQ